MLKLYLLFCFFLANGLFCFMTELVLQSPLLMVTFTMNLICILIGLRQSVNQPKVNLDTIIWVFVYMFFFLAPIVQIKFSAYFPNSLPILKEDVIKANMVVLVWNVVYLLLRRRGRPGSRADTPTAEKSGLEFVGKGVRAAYFLFSLTVFLATIALFKTDFFLGFADYGAVIGDKSLLLITNITVQGAVFANWLFAFDRRRNVRHHVWINFYFILSTIILIHQLSPFNTNRSYLGFCMILIVYLFYSHKVKPGPFIWVIFSGLLLVFPFLNYFRYGFKGIEIPPLDHLMFDQLTELHFDAFSNMIATFKYVDAYGMAFGYQMLGVFLFFVPRSLWTGKPLSSGEAVGDFIATRYEMDFSNISNPIPSEFYLNFGWAGIVAGAAIIAWLVNKLEAGTGRSRYAHALIAGFLFVIFRGDLMNAFAYCSGTYIIMVYVPTMMSKSRKTSWLLPARRVIDG